MLDDSATRVSTSVTTSEQSQGQTIKKCFDTDIRKKLIGLSVCVLAVFLVLYFYVNSIPAECSNGYEGDDCVDIDECSTTLHNCYQKLICKNTPGSFECHCSAGFNATKEDCKDIDECATSKHTCYRNFNCRNTEGSFECYCLDGFNATEEDCVDVDECEQGRACENNLNCTNSIGSYSCSCLDGFETQSAYDQNLMKEVHSCIDVDECEKQDVCPKDAKCENSQGSYSCNCLDGFEGKFCQDIDECNTTISCHTNAKCLNTEGSYTCSCKAGYYGTGDSCLPGRCPDSNCPENQKCVSANTIECECKDGFHFNSASVCVDIDECEVSATTICNTPAECVNTFGSYKCEEKISTTSATTKALTTKRPFPTSFR